MQKFRIFNTKENLAAAVLSHEVLQLSGDIVTNLQYQIDQLKDKHTSDYDRILALIDALRNNTSVCTVVVKDTNGNPIQGVACTNLGSQTVFTGIDGKATGSVSGGITYSPTFANHLDIEGVSFNSIKTLAGMEYEIPVTVSFRNFLQVIATGTYYFTGATKRISFSLVAGGGGGAGAEGHGSKGGGGRGGGGGGGGSVLVENAVPSIKTSYPIYVGKGGSGGSRTTESGVGSIGGDGKTGGSTTFFGHSASGGGGGKCYRWTQASDITAEGGRAGSGGGDGGGGWTDGGEYCSHPDGYDGSAPYITSFDTMSKNGPGGGGTGYGSSRQSFIGTGGKIGGGNGSSSANGGDGTNGGGGGGDGYGAESPNSRGGNGGNGFVTIRMYQ